MWMQGKYSPAFHLGVGVLALVIVTTSFFTFSGSDFGARWFFAARNGPQPQTMGTSIFWGHAEIEQFRSHLACISDSGRWEYNNTPQRIPWNFYADTFVHTCDDRHRGAAPGNIAFPKADVIAREGGDWKVREVLKWTWQTNSSCPFLALDRTDFCKKMGPGRNILLVGDSINHEIQWAFMNNLMTNYSVNGWSMSGVRSTQGEEVCGDVLAGGGFNISWVRNDRLSPVDTVQDDSPNNVYQWPWLAHVEDWNVKILILNRGAHYQEDQGYAKALQDILSLLRNRYPDLIVLYRNTPPGHLDCMSYSAPLKERQPPTGLPNHWGDFQVQNEMAKSIVERAGYIYMDVDSMLSLRPDGHVNSNDCLHYCIPGPLDVVVQLFYNMIVRIL